MQTLSIKTNERLYITGQTGSGKTYLAKGLLSSVNRLVVLDGKGTLGNWGLLEWNWDSKRKLRREQPARIRVLPPIGEKDLTEFWNDILYECFHIGDLLIYIDEIYSVAIPGKNPPDGLWTVYTRGRELGVGVWGVSQRPAWTPIFTMSESDVFACFRLQLEEDRKRMSAFMGPQVLEKPDDKYGFHIMRNDWEDPVYISKYTGKILSIA
jgi:energy-coupling factor transporter ATP-binding protein EcfA2